MELPICDIKPHFTVPFRALANPVTECSRLQQLIHLLKLSPHIEGGYFRETDRDGNQIVCPDDHEGGPVKSSGPARDHRALSTTRLYLLTPSSPIQPFNRNRSRVVHTLHRGRGIYVILKDGQFGGVQVESFIVGQNVANGERLQWVVEGGCYKAAFLIPDHGTTDSGSGLLISETTMPGFEYKDHGFLQGDQLSHMVDQTEFKQLRWLLRENFTQGSDFP